MANYDLAGLKVLLVDDNANMLKLLSMILNAMGIRNLHCLDQPQRAVDEIRRLQPQLVITDILMTPVNGIDLITTIRWLQPDQVAFTPIFVLSGFTDREHVLSARDAGAHEVLAKPISARSLYERICSLIEHPRDFVATERYFGPDRRTGKRAFSGPERRAGQDSDPEDFFELDI